VSPFLPRILLIAGLVALTLPGRGLNIVFDYTYDTGNFFGGTNTWRRAILERAADDIEARIADTTLRAISSNGSTGLLWELDFSHPSSSGFVVLSNRAIPANVVLVFVGAKSFGGGGGYEDVSFGETGGAWFDNVNPANAAHTNFAYNVLFRGQPGGNISTGANTQDFGPWGGSVSFANNVTNWYFDPDPSTIEAVTNKLDFYSVAIHELFHVLGFGTAGEVGNPDFIGSWSAKIVSNKFTGTNAARVFGTNVPISTSNNPQHWVQTITNRASGGIVPQEASLTPAISGAYFRKYITDLDWAAMKDIGWQVVPLPGSEFVIMTNTTTRVGTNFITALTWRAQPGESNVVLFATNLAGPFTAVSTNLVATNVVGRYTYTNSSPRGFFRIRMGNN
jgi:hypothetical protein